MSKAKCCRDGCGRTRSDLGMLLSRRRVPQFRSEYFCSAGCLERQIQGQLSLAWKSVQQERNRRIPRPRLGSILLQNSLVTPDQLEQAVTEQLRNRQGRIGEWLVRLGFLEEHQVTFALSKQCGLPMLNLHDDAKPDAARMLPGKVAKSSRVVPVGFDERKDSVLLASGDPVTCGFQQAVRRMLGKNVISDIGDSSVVETLIQRSYKPDELDLSGVEQFETLQELLDLIRRIVRTAIERKVENMEAELLESGLWIRLEWQGHSEYLFHVHPRPVYQQASCLPRPELAYARGV